MDYGGGIGIFTRMMRDLGHDFYWYDKYSRNICARGFEYEHGTIISFISAFELFEHLAEPKEEFIKLKKIAPNILISTKLYGDGKSYPEKDWFYLSPQTGQHISFYSEKTMQYLARANNMFYYQINDDYHFFTTKRISRIKWSLVMKTVFGKLISYYMYIKSKKYSLIAEDNRLILNRFYISEK